MIPEVAPQKTTRELRPFHTSANLTNGHDCLWPGGRTSRHLLHNWQHGRGPQSALGIKTTADLACAHASHSCLQRRTLSTPAPIADVAFVLVSGNKGGGIAIAKWDNMQCVALQSKTFRRPASKRENLAWNPLVRTWKKTADLFGEVDESKLLNGLRCTKHTEKANDRTILPRSGETIEKTNVHSMTRKASATALLIAAKRHH